VRERDGGREQQKKEPGHDALRSRHAADSTSSG
jgi:hypothetical protein